MKTRNIPQHNKSSLHQSHRQHLLKWREKQSISTKVGNTTRVSTLSRLFNIEPQLQQIAEGDQGDINWKERG